MQALSSSPAHVPSSEGSFAAGQMSRGRPLVPVLAGCALALLSLGAADVSPPPTFRLSAAASPVRVDGELDEPAWKTALMLELPYEIDPGENSPARVRTECLLTHDNSNLYVAFRAFDPDPTSIRAHYMDRDQAWDDDWVMLELDPFLDHRRGFQFIANPLGVQMDCVLDEVAGGGSSLDTTWDALWESTGRITPDGYVVEMAIPLSSLRFPRTAEGQRWGFQACRSYPRRFPYFLRLTPWNRNLACSLCENAVLVGFEGASHGRSLELDPTITATWSEPARSDRDSEQTPGSATLEPGLSLGWGPTPNISLNATVQPDFSHVEADAAQLEVNTRFALFYPEKRPFFLESADIFSTPLDAVYSRTLVDPSWGLKLTGKESRHAFGLLLAEDELAILLLPNNQQSDMLTLNQEARTAAVRYRFDLGRRSTAGVLLTDRASHGYHNRAVGCDALFALSPSDSIHVQLVQSDTRYPDQVTDSHPELSGSLAGHGLHAAYRHEARNWHWWLLHQQLDRGLRLDAGFLPRVDATSTSTGTARVFWPQGKAWFSRITVTLEGTYAEDEAGTLTDRELDASLELAGPLQSRLAIRAARRWELFAGTLHDQTRLRLELAARPGRSLELALEGTIGDGIDYSDARPAELLQISPRMSWFVGRHLRLGIDHSLERLSVPEGRLYEARLSQARLVYQLDLRTFARVLLQHLEVDRTAGLASGDDNPASRRFYFQLHLSYRVNSRTQFFVGYSEQSLHQEYNAFPGRDRVAFVKLSYAWVL